jgi:hypothetical protein
MMTHTHPSSSSWLASPHAPPASFHHRSTTASPTELSPVSSHRRPLRHPPLLQCYRIGGGRGIDPDLGVLSLVRNPNLLGWISHRRRSRDREISANPQESETQGVAAAYLLVKLGVQLQPPCPTLSTTLAGDDENLRAARSGRLLVQLRSSRSAASAAAAAAAAGNSCPGGGTALAGPAAAT